MVDAEEAGTVRPCSPVANVIGEAADSRADVGAWRECGAGGSCHGVNANQVFKWRRALKRGELDEPAAASTALLPVTLSAPCEAAIETGEAGAKEQPTAGGAIHIEFPGRAMISVESGADPVLLRSILESLRK